MWEALEEVWCADHLERCQAMLTDPAWLERTNSALEALDGETLLRELESASALAGADGTGNGADGAPPALRCSPEYMTYSLHIDEADEAFDNGVGGDAEGVEDGAPAVVGVEGVEGVLAYWGARTWRRRDAARRQVVWAAANHSLLADMLFVLQDAWIVHDPASPLARRKLPAAVVISRCHVEIDLPAVAVRAAATFQIVSVARHAGLASAEPAGQGTPSVHGCANLGLISLGEIHGEVTLRVAEKSLHQRLFGARRHRADAMPIAAHTPRMAAASPMQPPPPPSAPIRASGLPDGEGDGRVGARRGDWIRDARVSEDSSTSSADPRQSPPTSADLPRRLAALSEISRNLGELSAATRAQVGAAVRARARQHAAFVRQRPRHVGDGIVQARR